METLAIILEVLLIAGVGICVLGAPLLYFILTAPIRRFPGKAAWALYRRRKQEFSQDNPVTFVSKKLERNERWFRRSTRIMVPLFLVIDALVTTRMAFRMSGGHVSISFQPVLVLFVALIWILWLVPIAMHAVAYRYRRVFREFLSQEGAASPTR